ncbi:hypothetical protein ACIPSA_48700 [Streptomyces sp. NPDC086549]|uniref:hypothetical protein n=1 Tax=Streptomyces sp. NPDC086549 TaxID=3365752 RepID=UPI003815DE29
MSDPPIRQKTCETPYTRTRAHTPGQLLGGGLLVLAALLVAGTLLGPVGFTAIRYPIPGHGALMSQLVALDVFSVAVVAPVAVCAAVLVLRRHPLGGVLALAPSVYTAYMVPQYVLGPQYLRYDGNSEAFFPLELALFVLGWTTALLAWQQINPATWTPPGRRERLTGGVLIPLLAIVTCTRYVPAILDAAGTHPSAADYQEGPGYFWTIALLDLGVGLPAAIAAIAGMRHGRPWARKVAMALSGWLALIGPAVAAMAISAWLRNVPNASAGQAAGMTALGLLFAALGLTLLTAVWPTAPQARHKEV